MSDVVLAWTVSDAAAAAAVEQHHAQLAGSLAAAVERLLTATSRRDDDVAAAARDDLAQWCRRELVPHALAEETTLYPAAQAKPEGRLLVDGMLAEHVAITGLVTELGAAPDLVRAAAAAKALAVMFESHLAKENDLVLPLLAAAPDVSLAELLGGMHELLGSSTSGHPDNGHDHGHDSLTSSAAEHGRPAHGGHTCGCGDSDTAEYPELDARAVPHAIRHATIFGALQAVPTGGGMVLVAPHDPLPLLAQLEQRFPGCFDVDYLQRGPDAWRLTFLRRA